MEFQQLLTIEGNPLLPEELAVFEMFDRERWSDERELAYINELIDRRVGKV